MATNTTDQAVLAHIERLIAEEQRLYGQGTISDEDKESLSKLNVQLDRCWDLLRQRRALRSAGGDPDDAEVRPASVVEKYRG